MWKVEEVHISTNFSQIYWGYSLVQEKQTLFAIRSFKNQNYIISNYTTVIQSTI